MSDHFNRRTMLKFFGPMALTLGSTWPLFKFNPNQNYYRVNFSLKLPRWMNAEEAIASTDLFEDRKKASDLLAAFKKNGLIHKEEHFYHGTHADWIVDFNSRAAFEKWIKLSWELNTLKKPVHEIPGYQLFVNGKELIADKYV